MASVSCAGTAWRGGWRRRLGRRSGRSHSPRSSAACCGIGGSPLRKITQEQAQALETELNRRHPDGPIFQAAAAMRFAPPLIRDVTPQVAQDALKLTGDGKILLSMRRAWHDSKRAVLFEPRELIEKLAS